MSAAESLPARAHEEVWLEERGWRLTLGAPFWEDPIDPHRTLRTMEEAVEEQRKRERYDLPHSEALSHPCPRCHGSGIITEDPMPGCPAGPSVYEERECGVCEGSGEERA